MRTYNDLLSAILTLFATFLQDLKPLIRELAEWEGQEKNIGVLNKHGGYIASFIVPHFASIKKVQDEIAREAQIAEERAQYNVLQQEHAAMKAELEALKASKAKR